MHTEDNGKHGNPEVSIIVPVYNVEKYLRQCLDSIQAQTFTNWECVVVDDGSTDTSGSICDEFAKRDGRFKVIHTSNGGLSAARNKGITEASGNYIAFCDSDDWMEPTMLSVMYGRMSEYDADIVQVGYWKDYGGYEKVKHTVKETSVYNREEALIELLRDKKIPSYMWIKMFRRDIVDADFPEGKTFEDIYTNFKWFNKARKIVCDPAPLYHYRMRKGSIVHTFSPQYRLDFIKAVCFRADEVLGLGLSNFKAADHDALVVKACVSGAKIIARNEKDKAKGDALMEQISEKLRSVKNPGPEALGMKLWFRGRLLAAKPKSFARLMRLVVKADLHSKYRCRKLYD